MSETHPVLCNTEENLQKFILDKYVNQCGDKAFHDTCALFTQLNPILQNNYNETLEILRSQHLASRVTAKKKSTPVWFNQPRLLSAEILPREKKCCHPMHSQIGKARQKMPGNFTNANTPIMKEDVTERNVSQPIHKDNKCDFVVCGVNLKADKCHEMVPAHGISGTKSQVLNSLDKFITPAEDVPKKRIIFVDYIPISKPVKIYTFGDEPSCQDSSLPVINYSVINECPEGKAIRKDQSDDNEDASNKKDFLDRTSPDSMELSGHDPLISFEEDSEISSTTISTVSSRYFHTEEDTSFKSQEGEEQPITPSLSRVISIPTAQCDVSESNRDLPMQKTTGH